MLEMEVATYSVWRERFMRKRMMLFAAGTVIFVSTAQNTFAEEETGGIRKIADMVIETDEYEENTGHRPSKLYCFNKNWQPHIF